MFHKESINFPTKGISLRIRYMPFTSPLFKQRERNIPDMSLNRSQTLHKTRTSAIVESAEMKIILPVASCDGKYLQFQSTCFDTHG